jgi:hypothetical protein
MSRKGIRAARRAESLRRRVGCRSKVRRPQRSARTSSVRLRSPVSSWKRRTRPRRRVSIRTGRSSSKSQPKKRLMPNWQKSESSYEVHARRNRRPRKLMRRHRSRLRTKRSSNTFSRIGGANNNSNSREYTFSSTAFRKKLRSPQGFWLSEGDDRLLIPEDRLSCGLLYAWPFIGKKLRLD